MMELGAGADRGADSLSAYEVKRAVGKGSYGEVLLVIHKRDGKQVNNNPTYWGAAVAYVGSVFSM